MPVKPSIKTSVKAVLTDIEGTTTDIQFVHQVLFPFARQHLADFVTQQQQQPQVSAIINQVKAQLSVGANLADVITTLTQWIDKDIKAPPLKTLQGLIWQGGYDSGELKGHLYPDVLPVLQQWHDAGIILGVYSSGSVAAQKLLFSHCEYGDITPLFNHYFDTQVGHKRQIESYQNISQQMALPTQTIVFLSDIVAELDAAKSAGMQTIQLHRDGQPTGDHAIVEDFNHIQLTI